MTRPPIAYVTAQTSGIDTQNRTDTPTSAGAEISFVIGGPSPQITTTPAITAPANGRRRVGGGVPRPDGDPGNWGARAHPVDRSRAPCADLQLETLRAW